MAVLPLGAYQLTIDKETGLLQALTHNNGPNVLGHGAVELAACGVWIAHQKLTQPPVFRSHITMRDELTIESGIGSLVLRDQFKASGDLLERRWSVQNTGEGEVQLTGLRVELQGVSVGDPASCLFEAPGNALRPRLPLAIAARQSPDPKRRADLEFAPGAEHRWGQQMSDAPDVGPGLMVVYNPVLKSSILTWYVSRTEAATPWVSGDGTHATLGFDIALAGWLAPGELLEAGTQYIAVHQGEYESALALYRNSVRHTGITPVIYGQLDRAADWNALYEVHPGQFGGFNGLAERIPALAAMGIDTLYLLPVQAHRNKQGLPWDENWESIGSPYAIHDYEKLEPSLGTEDDFRHLVAEAHRSGVRVLMDFVPQGCSLESRYVSEHPEWFARDEQGNRVHSHGWNDTWSFDWANPDYQSYMIGWATDFVRRFDIDGFRIDAPHGKEPNWDRGLPYHASVTSLGARSMLEQLRQQLRILKPDAALYCELFGPLWINSHDISNDYSPYAMALTFFERNLSAREFGSYLADYWAVMPQTEEGVASPRICFTETHDTRGWPAYALRGSDVQQALLGILVMSGFVPMIWAGQEARQEDFLRGLLLARRQSAAIRRGRGLFNAVTIDDRKHYRQGEHPANQVFAVVRQHNDEIILGIASLFPEHITFEFGLPVGDLQIDKNAAYQLRDLITGQVWNEYGRTSWKGSDLKAVALTPRMYHPYIFKLEQVRSNR